MKSANKSFDELITNYISENISDVDFQHLSALLKSDKKLNEQFSEIIKLRSISLVPSIEASKDINFRKIMDKIEVKPVQSYYIRYFSILKNTAAILIFIVSLSVASYYVIKDIVISKEKFISYQTIVPVGSQTKIILPDSSVIWLNSGTTIKYNATFGRIQRDVYLSGEGYFEIMKDVEKPFVVHINNLEVKVHGTEFNVRGYSDDKNIEIDLINGQVSVLFPDSLGIKSYKMEPNNKFVFNKQNGKITYSKSEAYKSALWTTGKLCFVDATIEQIIKDLERKYSVRIFIESQSIKNEVFSGSLNLNLPLIDILTYIDVDKKFAIYQNGNSIIIKTKN